MQLDKYKGTTNGISIGKIVEEHMQKVKREHDTTFPEGEENLHLYGDVYEDWMETLEVHNISNIYIIYNNTTTTTIDIRRSTSYWIIDEESGNITFFCNVQTTRNTSTS
jgi:hypothetical protein